MNPGTGLAEHLAVRKPPQLTSVDTLFTHADRAIDSPTGHDDDGSMLDRIMVAYNDSTGARRALEVAMQLALAHRSELVAVAVIAQLPQFATIDTESDEELAAEVITCCQWLTAATDAASEHGIDLHTKIRIGQLKQELSAVTANADLLVLGRSRHSIWRRLIGSTAEKVAQQAKCPVLIAI